MTKLLCPIVGEHFWPPAKLILASLPTGASLRLVPEPTNPYDPKAIQVWACPKDIPISVLASESFQSQLAGYGLELSDLMSPTEGWHCGYIANSDGKLGKAAISLGKGGNREAHELVAGLCPGEPDVEVAWGMGLVKARLSFSLEGRPEAELS